MAYMLSFKKKMKYYKVILCGDSNVGKTALRFRYFGRGFRQSYMMTMGADFALKRLEDGVIQIWDLAGQVTFSRIRKDYYVGVHGILLVYDLTRESTFNNLEVWIDEIVRYNGKMVPMVLVGNKLDLLETGHEHVAMERVDEFRNTLKERYGYNFPFIMSSALSGENVNKLFTDLIEEISNQD